MTTTSPLPEFKLTGVWLDHFLESEVPPIDLFWRFRENGGTGVILDSAGWPSPYQTTKVVEMTKDLGLQAIQMVSYRVLSNAATSKEQLDPLVRAIELADAVLLTFTNAEVFELLGQLPERPWLVLAGPQTELPQDFWRVYPGPLLGFMLDRPATRNDQNPPFPSPREARDLVDEWVMNLEGLEPVFYSVPLVDPNAPSASAASIPDIAAAVREGGVRALVIESQQYDKYPELREVAGRLAGFPDELPSAEGVGRVIGTHDGLVWSVAVTPGGQVVSGGADGTVRLWDLAGDEEREPLGRHDSRAARWSPAVKTERCGCGA